MGPRESQDLRSPSPIMAPDYKDILEKVMMQRTQQFSAFVCHRKNPEKTHAQLLEN